MEPATTGLSDICRHCYQPIVQVMNTNDEGWRWMHRENDGERYWHCRLTTAGPAGVEPRLGDSLRDRERKVLAEQGSRERPPYPPCAGHKEVQHRDGKPPWCDACGWNRGHPAVPPVRQALYTMPE